MTDQEGRRAVVVVNSARVRDAVRLRAECERAAAAAGWQRPLLVPTTPAERGAAQASSALAAGAELIVVVGGDGTVRECAQALTGTGVPLAIVPCGSANLTARALGLPGRLAPALQVAFRGHDRRIDLGCADGVVFTAMAGIGLDAAVVAGARCLARRVTGWPAYAAAATGQLLRRPVTFTIRIDGGEPLSRLARCVTVGNSGALPGGFAVMPDALLDDGRLDVVVLAPAGPFGWAHVGYRIAVGSRQDDPQLERFRAKTVEIRAAAPTAVLPRQADGELIGPASTLTVRVLPAALAVRVPGRPR